MCVCVWGGGSGDPVGPESRRREDLRSQIRVGFPLVGLVTPYAPQPSPPACCPTRVILAACSGDAQGLVSVLLSLGVTLIAHSSPGGQHRVWWIPWHDLPLDSWFERVAFSQIRRSMAF